MRRDAASFCVVGCGPEGIGNLVVALSCSHVQALVYIAAVCAMDCMPINSLNTSWRPTYMIRRQERAAGLHSPRVQFGPTGVNLFHQGLLRRTGAHGADAVQGAQFVSYFLIENSSNPSLP